MDQRSGKPAEQLLVVPTRQDFQMTLEKLFLWDQKTIYYYDLNKEFTDETKKKLGFEISQIEPSFVRNIATRENADVIAIVIEQI